MNLSNHQLQRSGQWSWVDTHQHRPGCEAETLNVLFVAHTFQPPLVHPIAGSGRGMGRSVDLWSPVIPGPTRILRCKYLLRVIFCNFAYFRVVEFLARNKGRGTLPHLESFGDAVLTDSAPDRRKK